MRRNMEPDDDNTRTHVPLTNGTVVSHYRIIEKIGSGGMGEVYLAEDTQLDRKVALKFLPPHLCQDADCRARFKREAQAAAKLDHPNIVSVFEVGEFQGRPFFSMQHVEGRSLKEVLSGKAMPLERIVQIGVQVCEGLQAAHERGITHRDVKPSNILIDTHGRARIVDFGLASVLGMDQLTKTGSTLGTIGYMSPEQVRGEQVDHRTDLFSLGVVLYEMIAGHSPFKADTEAATLHAITDSQPEVLARFRRDVQPELQTIMDKALDKDLATRYQHADELSADLKRLSPGAAVGAPPRRDNWNRYVVTAAVAVLLCVAGYWAAKKYLVGKGEAPDAGRKMLAVLPFENLGPADQNYFADGITEEIITKLTKIEDLGVISRTSAMTYKNTQKSLRQIGSELGVDYVLEGTVRWEKEGEVNRVRINPQLVRVQDDLHVWAETYDRALTEVFAVQSEIAQQVVSALDTTLLGSEKSIPAAKPTGNLSAYDYYLRGKEYAKSVGPKDWVLAQTMFERAVALDSGFALGYAALSQMHSRAYWFYRDHTSRRLQLAKACAERALSIDPGLPEAHQAMGVYYYWGKRDYNRALEHYKRALDARPNDADFVTSVAMVERRLSQWTDCLRDLEKAADYDPRNWDVMGELMVTHRYLRHYQEAARWAEQYLAIRPDDEYAAVGRAGIYVLAEGNVDRGKALIDSIPLRNYMLEVSLWCLDEAVLGILDDFRQRAITQMPCETPADSLARYLASMLPYRPASESPAEHHRRVAYADSARSLVTRFLRDLPDDPEFHGLLGLTLAVSGRADSAIAEGEKAVRMLPLSKDGLTGAQLMGSLAVIYVLSGKYDAAVDQLDQLLSIPSDVSVPLLHVDPTWAPLQSNPRFQKLLEKYGT